jgi:phage shock protein PspC (stress-responsive transcriptional regulator)
MKKIKEELPYVPNRITRTYNDTIIGGVCGGMCDYYGMNPTFLRLLWFLSIFCYGIGIALYIIAWIMLPSDSNSDW